MQQRIEITADFESPDLAIYRTLRRPLDHFTQRIFVAEGEKVVRRLLDSQLKIRSVLLTPAWYTELESIPRLHEVALRIYIAQQAILETIVGFHLHQGIMATAEMPDDPSLEQILSRLKHPGIVVALDGLVNAENVGVIVRNCAAFGADLLLSGETSSSPYLRRSVRNSMGTIFTLPVLHLSSLAAGLRRLHDEFGYEIFAADLSGEQMLYCADLKKNICIVLGNEGNGISPSVQSISRGLTIPMANGTDSLNVANASAVILSEALRQRKFITP